MNASQETVASRAVMPDLLRAFALVGIAVVNVIGFAQPIETGFFGDALAGPADRAAYGAVTALFLMKAYPLFAMMFGAGLAWQLAAAERAGVDGSARYFRRIAALIVLGLLHFIFFWYGDILVTYGILGCLLFAMRDISPKVLVRVGLALIAANTVILLLFATLLYAGEVYAPEEMAEAVSADLSAAQIIAFTQGSFLDAAAWRLSQLPLVLPSVMVQQGIAVFGFFCFGLAAVKVGIIDKPQARLWKLARWVFLPVGLAGNVAGAMMMLDATSIISGQFMLASAILMAFSPLLALGYAGVIALFSSGIPGPIRRFLARAGSASLTAYLFQSAVLSFIFAGYGFGYFGLLGAAEATLVALLVALASLVFTGIWRSFARHGPMEYLLRRITYWSRP